MFQFRATTTLALLGIFFSSSNVLAFTPSSLSSTQLQGPSAWGVPSTSTKFLAATESNEIFVDENFDDVNMVRLLGLNRVKKIMRRHKRNAAATEEASAPAAPVASKPKAEKKVAKVPGIIIAGAPASGKGTQCELIKKEFNVVHLSTGDMLRAAVADKTPVGVAAKEYMDSGKLVPDDVIIGVVKDRMNLADCKAQGWLLDGFPRTRAQADALAEAGVSADCFLFLNVPDEILVERVVGRRTDPETGKIYHMTFSPPDDEEVLARLEQRSDDTEEKVKVRLEQFHANVAAVKGCYTDISVEIDGTSKPEDVAAKISEALKEKCGVFA